LITGLPPGPIRIPSIQAIEAVLNSAQHDYYYMCASPDFSGKHVFAKNLTQHSVNAQRYRSALNRRNIR
ncbi:MAG: endolytic transglycosylase MltG, partial [Tannerellaceae bacterium]